MMLLSNGPSLQLLRAPKVRGRSKVQQLGTPSQLQRNPRVSQVTLVRNLS
uniref:Uncharacterized protein n=1 Tax=Rhizophora mucronata TaxID=61149 RepID=A0A2P2QLU3_RHIMU